MLPKPIVQHIQAHFETEITSHAEPQNIRIIGGGDISKAYAFRYKTQDYFIKINRKSVYPSMFEREADGLRLLASTNCIEIPEVIYAGFAEDFQFLLLHFINSGKRVPDFMSNFGASLADLHKNTNVHFGLDHDNYIGSLPQSNKKNTDWETFFMEERLNPLLKMGTDKGLVDKAIRNRFEAFFRKMNELFPTEIPALLHGDLWSGNYMTGNSGKACLYDPAVYYGHREADLAMTTLFGGFDTEFYEAYHAHFPLEPDWKNRLPFYNLYPLLVHVNLFGGAYVESIKRILNRF